MLLGEHQVEDDVAQARRSVTRVVHGIVQKGCQIKRSAGSWVAVLTPGTSAVATIRFRAPAVGDRLPIDVVQRVRIAG
jgi:hypothetical protein